MKKLIGIILSLVILFSTISSVHLNSRAENNKYGSSSSKFDFQDEWKNKKTYPVLPQDEDWSALSYIELLEACNMPDELVDQCSTDKLADLVLDYPFLIDTLCFETAQQGIDYLKTHSNICEEYFSRDDSINILLQKYEDLEVNYEMLKDKSVKDKSKNPWKDSQYIKELFFQMYFAVKADTLDEKQKLKLKNTIGKNHDMKKGKCDDYSTALLIYDNIQKLHGEVSRDLIPDNIYNDSVNKNNNNGNLSYFTKTSNYIYTMSHGSKVYKGTYTKYGESVGCYKYYSGDYTSEEKSDFEHDLATAHPTWVIHYSTATKKYNCHSYAWITNSSSNIYWINNPSLYASSSSFSYIGNNCSSALNGDKIVINASYYFKDGFGYYTTALHSANVITSGSNKYNTITKSKMGSGPLVTSPLADQISFYNGVSYTIYR